MKKILIILISVSILLIGCTKKDVQKASSMEELYNEQGVPVKLKTIELQTFSKDLSFNTIISGNVETNVYASLSDQIHQLHVKIGDYVKKDQVIMEFPVNNPAASYKQAEAAYLLAKQTFDRMKNLYQSGGISKQDLDGAETQYKVSLANWDAVQQAVKVRAPIDGLVTDVMVRPSQKVNPGDLLCTVAQISQLRARVWLTDTEIAYAKKGGSAVFSWNNKDYQARISDVAMSMNPDQKAFGVDLLIQNQHNELKSGINGIAKLNMIKKAGTIIIPRNVIQKGENNELYVYIADQGKASKRIVETGLTNNLEIEITKGLNHQDALIVEGFNILNENQKIKVIE